MKKKEEVYEVVMQNDEIDSVIMNKMSMWPEDQVDFLSKIECVRALQSILDESDWEILDCRCIQGEGWHAYAVAHKISDECAKKRLTRAKIKAAKILIKMCPEIFHEKDIRKENEDSVLE